eukprot:2787589-Pyramimonas_sp.AAC.1
MSVVFPTASSDSALSRVLFPTSPPALSLWSSPPCLPRPAYSSASEPMTNATAQAVRLAAELRSAQARA